MKVIDILSETMADPFVYHGTSQSHLPDIARQGLMPNPPGPEGWPEFDADPYDDEDAEQEQELDPAAFEPRTFAFDDFESAKEYAANYPDGVVLRLPANFGWDYGATDYPYLYTTRPIPASMIEVLWTDGKWYPIQAIKASPGDG